MKKAILLPITILLTLLVYAQSPITGTWKGKTAGGPNGPMELQYTFKVEGNELTGSVNSPMGSTEIENGKVDGNKFSFETSFGQWTITNSGEVLGKDEIKISNPRSEMTITRVTGENAGNGVAAGSRAAFGQNQKEEIGYGKISGVVKDGDTGEPVPFATIALINDAGETKDGTIADESGSFVLKSVPSGHYKISVSFIGYEPIEQNTIEITGKGESYEFNDLKLSSVATELDEVVVEGQRELIEEKVDRIVYNAEQDATTTGGDAVDVLRRVPLLSVDLDGNVSLRGSSNIKVLIDNRPSTISASSIGDALKQIPADQIKSVEVITSPSARFDAEGTGGIINIITKKNNLQGANLNLRTSAGLRGSNLGLNAGLRKGRTGFTLGGFGRSGYNTPGEFENEQRLFDEFGNELSYTTQEAETQNERLFGRYNLGWDYEINKYNWIGANANFGIFNFNTDQNNRLSQTFQGGTLVNENLQDVTVANLSNNIDVNLNFIRTFEEKGKEFSILTLYSQNDRTNDFITKTLDMDTESVDSRLKNINDSYNKEFTIQADWIEPFGEDHIVEFGAKNISRFVISDFTYLFAPDNGAYVEASDARFSNQLDYNQNVTAGYLSYTVDFLEDYSAKVGGRYEYTTIEALYQDETDLDIPSYGTFVPSVNLSKSVGMGKTVKAAYNRRIARPSLQFLNPNIQASNPLDITQGNPSLDPEFTDNYEVSFSTFKNGTSINISAFMRNTNGSIQAVRESLGQDTVYTSYANIGEEDAYGLSLFTNFRFGEKVMLNGGIDGYYAVLNNNVGDPLYNASNQGFVINGRVFGSYQMTEKWALQLFSFFRGKRVQLQGYQTGFYVYSLSLNRSFADDKGSIGFGAENFVTNTFIMRSEINSAFVDQSNTNVMYNTNFKINFTYRIGRLNANQDRRRRRSVDNNDLKEGSSNNMDYN